MVENWLHSGACQLLVARMDEQVIGMIRVTHLGRTIWLNSFVALESLRGRGIGRRVLRLYAHLREKRVLLEVETLDGCHLPRFRYSPEFKTIAGSKTQKLILEPINRTKNNATQVGSPLK